MAHTSDLSLAARALEPDVSLAIAREGDVLLQCQGKGIRPLLELLENRDLLPLLHESALADRVLGKAAALLALRGNVKWVYAPVMSAPAEELFRRHGVHVAYKQLPGHILNRQKDGVCPMELEVENLDDPFQAPARLRTRLEQLMSGRASGKQ